ncbi:MAG: hypothetical protein ACM34N_11065 [Ignavibacteria bacterium]
MSGHAFRETTRLTSTDVSTSIFDLRKIPVKNKMSSNSRITNLYRAPQFGRKPGDWKIRVIKESINNEKL